MKRLLKITFFILAIIFLIIIYARYIGTMGLTTKEYTIIDKNIPEGFDGLKIVHFSDIHYNRAITLKKIESIVKEINLIKPDIVVFTGDLLDKDAILTNTDYDELGKILKKINAPSGKYAILGNHDYEKEEENAIKILKNSNFTYLENTYDIIYDKYGNKVFIGGIGSVIQNKDDIDKTLNSLSNKDNISYKIILIHEPDIADEIATGYKINLILAGHSHGGQIRLPLIGALYTPSYAKKYQNEYYKINDCNLYISTGIGVSTINYRLWDKPSINFYRINSH